MEGKVSKHTREGDHPSTAHKSPLTYMTLLQGYATSQLFAECNGPNQATEGSSQHATSPPSANIAISMSKPERDGHILRISRLYIWDYASAHHAVEVLENDQIEELTRRRIPVAIQRRIAQGCKKLSCMN